MNIDVAALMASSAPAQPRSVWLLPTVAVVLMVLALMVGLSMLRKINSSAAQTPGARVAQAPTAPVGYDVADAPASAPPDATAAPQAVLAAPASAVDPDFEARAARARALQSARDWAGLVAFAQEWAQSSPARNEPLNYLAIAYAGLGDYQHAAEPLQKLLAREPGNANTRSLLAEAYLQTQRWADAAALYKQMVMESPKDARQWNNYGAALSGAGQQAQAVAALETAVQLDPTFKQAWTNLGNVYQAMGDSARASAAFANAR